ncbi:hypothetical protein [Trichormus azollae]
MLAELDNSTILKSKNAIRENRALELETAKVLSTYDTNFLAGVILVH